MKPRVLLVDDEPMLIRAVKRILGSQFELVGCSSGAEALLRLADPAGFAVVVSDLRMPVMDGAVFLKRAREVAPSTTQILLTGTFGFEEAIADQRERIFRVLEKPCPNDVLAQAIVDAVGQAHVVLKPL